MKKSSFQNMMLIITCLLIANCFALATSSLHSQVPQGIPYQAMIRDNAGAPLVNTAVTVRFTLHQNSINGAVEYQETQALTTNGFGLINTQFGQGTPTQGSFAGIIWSNTSKFIQVEANDGSGYVDMGTQQMMSVPYAMYSGAAATAISANTANSANTSVTAENGFSSVSVTGDTLYMANGTYIIVPGISAANFPPAILGCTDNAACNYNSAATQSDNSCLYQNATCNDNNANTTNDVINGSCVCAGTLVGNGMYVPGNGATDIDGNTYTSIIINGQEWMQQNLAVTKYRNGDPIPTGLSDAAWQSTTAGAYAIYNNDAANNTLYGKLYNWYAVNDSRALCPTGWHVPSDAEWTTLENSLGGSSVAGGKMKATTGWTSSNTGASNESGFTGLPGGYRDSNGTYLTIGNYGTCWSSSENSSSDAWNRALHYNYSFVDRNYYDKRDGFSVRCVRDSETFPIQGCTDGAACNFLANATQDDGSCLYLNATCDDGNANTINDVITAACLCQGQLLGCTNPQACNYQAGAVVDDGSCLIQGNVCNDNNASTVDDVVNNSCTCQGVCLSGCEIGAPYQGGVIAYIFQPGDAGYVAGEWHGLIAAAQDLPGTYFWGCDGTDISGADGYTIGTGAQNTLDIVNAGCGGAAQACADLVLNGYSDWFLPSFEELNQLYINLNSSGGFQENGLYWSSSEDQVDGSYAFNTDPWNTGGLSADKYESVYVRAVRAF